MERVSTMRKCLVAPEVVLVVLIFSPFMRSQSPQPQSGAVKGQKTAPAAPVPVDVDDWGHPVTAPMKGQRSAPTPRHDISGIWDPGIDPTRVLGVLGASAIPEDGKPEHELPYTPLGREALNRTKPTSGARSVLPADTNDPVFYCDPQGMPREDLYELRTTQILQTPQNVVILYQFGKVWRGGLSGGGGQPQKKQTKRDGHSIDKKEENQ